MYGLVCHYSPPRVIYINITNVNYNMYINICMLEFLYMIFDEFLTCAFPLGFTACTGFAVEFGDFPIGLSASSRSVRCR